jgi:uncharacterized Zn finger protein
MKKSDWFPKNPQQPPPKHGIRVKKLGTTWWGRRWIESLEHSSRDYLHRLGRGRAYARTGRVHDLKVSSGSVVADVTGSEEEEPYRVRFGLDVFTPQDWRTAIEAMAQEARFAAELLAGRMPQDIDAVFQKFGRSLFPRRSHDLETDCSCPDWANPCKHVAAMHYVLGEAFDKDPFLLFELRGRTKNQVLDELSRLRTGSAPGEQERERSGAEVAQAGVSLSLQTAADYERPPMPLPSLRFGFDAPQAAAAILDSVAAPPAWSLDEPPSEFFAELYARASDLAQQMALGTSEDENETQ